MFIHHPARFIPLYTVFMTQINNCRTLLYKSCSLATPDEAQNMTNRSPWISIGTLIFLILLGPQPNSLSAQGIGVATRAGTMGVGAEVSLGFYERFAIRGGFGKIDWDFMPEIPTSYFGLNFGLPGVDASLAETKATFPRNFKCWSRHLLDHKSTYYWWDLATNWRNGT